MQTTTHSSFSHNYYKFGLLAALAMLAYTMKIPAVHAQADRNISRELIDQLDILNVSLQTDGYVELLSHVDNQGLSQAETHTWLLDLDRTATYAITAVCDHDCGDIDLELQSVDANGILAQDYLDTPYPILEERLDAGRYRATIIMKQCQLEPCYSALRVFRQQ